MSERDRWAELVDAYQPKTVPPIAVQEADAESLTLPGAAHVTTELHAASGSAGSSVESDKPDHVDAHGGDSAQIPTGPDQHRSAGDERHEHYWIHTVTETIERGNAEFVSFTMPLAATTDDVAPHPVQVFGLNDLRTRADLIITDADGALVTGAAVYFGDRDVIDGANAASAFPIGARGFYEYRGRKEAWIVNLTDVAYSVSVVEYTSEQGQDVLGAMKSATS